MLESLEGRRGIVRAKPPIPALNGLFGKPTVVNNVLTFTSVPIILSKGQVILKIMALEDPLVRYLFSSLVILSMAVSMKKHLVLH